MGAFLYLLGDIVVSLFGEILLEITKLLDEEKHATPVAVVWFVIVGAILGAISGALVGWRISPQTAFLGVSLITTPVAIGALAHIGGQLRSRRHEISHLATWYGGAAIGLGLAAGRLGALRMMGQI